jgi:hypothetical protein
MIASIPCAQRNAPKKKLQALLDVFGIGFLLLRGSRRTLSRRLTHAMDLSRWRWWLRRRVDQGQRHQGSVAPFVWLVPTPLWAWIEPQQNCARGVSTSQLLASNASAVSRFTWEKARSCTQPVSKPTRYLCSPGVSTGRISASEKCLHSRRQRLQRPQPHWQQPRKL